MSASHRLSPEKYKRDLESFKEYCEASPQIQLEDANEKIKIHLHREERVRRLALKTIRFISKFRYLPGIGAEARRFEKEWSTYL